MADASSPQPQRVVGVIAAIAIGAGVHRRMQDDAAHAAALEHAAKKIHRRTKRPPTSEVASM
jgi:hypothetical protein